MSLRLLRRVLAGLLAVAAPSAGGIATPSAGGIATPPASLTPPGPPLTGAPAATKPSLADRLAWNPWERTRSGIRRLETGDTAGAAAALDTAFRLRSGDPRAAYNAGTGRLAAGRGDATAPLEQAARSADPALAPDAWYNLGNARLAAGDARGAVGAFVETLRRASDREDAKRNLELALRELERQQQRQQAGQQQQEQPQRSRKDSSDQDASGSPEARQPREPDSNRLEESKPSEGSSSQGGRQPESATQPQPGSPQGSQSRDGSAGSSTETVPTRLPDFRDQPDLDAKQAAALLQAVENLERQQRRERALERARERRSEDEDW